MSSFAEDISKWVKQSEINGGEVIRTIALESYKSLLTLSPVDEGRFRGSWRVGVNRVNGDVLPKGNNGRAQGMKYKDKPNGAEVAYGLARMTNAGWKDEIILSNSLPYAKRLEDGYSKQTGHRQDGIVGVTYEEARENLTRSIKNAVGAV